MVKKRFAGLAIVLLLLTFASVLTSANAQERVYYFGHEYAKIWINQDRTIDLLYDRSLTLESGTQIRWIEIGQPKGGFTIGEAKDQYGNVLITADTSSGNNYKVRVTLNQPLQAGQTINFTLTTNVAGMIYEDSTNPGNVGMQFAPAWDTQTTIRDVHVIIVLPPNVTQDLVKTGQRQWDNVMNDSETGNLAVYWETQNLAPNQQFLVGISFPANFVEAGAQTPSPTSSVGPTSMWTPQGTQGSFLDYVPFVIFLVFIIAVVVFIALAASKRSYQPPTVGMETLGVRRGLTAVEASYLLELKPTQIVTEILYGLLQKRAVWVESSKPSLKLRVMPEFQDKKGAGEHPLRYYEIDFIQATKQDGTLNEEKLARTVMTVRDTLEQKLKGYSRKDTVDYYRKIAEKAWTQVEQAGTDQIASAAYDEQLLWLMLDPNYRKRTETAFQTRVFEPNPLWFWYWYGYTQYHPHPVFSPNISTSKPISTPAKPISTPPTMPTQTAKPPSIPGADFANNIATSVENTSNNIVASIEKFANSILPPPPPKPAEASHAPAHHDTSCACACHSCACACACVSCACACAGGGVG